MSDDVKLLYRQSQDVLTCSGLDSRNSVMRVVDFYDKVVEVFNSQLFVPHTAVLPDPREHFSVSKPLPLNEYKMTRNKSKDTLAGIWPKLAWIVSKYQLSGAGSG